MQGNTLKTLFMLAALTVGIVTPQENATAQNITSDLRSKFQGALSASSLRNRPRVRTYPQAPQGQAAQMPYAPGAGAPAWSEIQRQGDAVKVQAYWSLDQALNREIKSSYTDFGHTPFLIAFQPPVPTAPETSLGGCPIADRPRDGVYFYDSISHEHVGNRNPPVYPTAGPSEITTSLPGFGVRGFMVNSFILGGASSQSPKDSYAIAATYLTGDDNPCAAADQEIGLWTNLTDGERNVYFDISDYTNCNGLGNCRTTPNGWDASSPVSQMDNIIVVTNPVTYEGTSTNLYYEMFLIPVGTAGSSVITSNSGYALRIAVVDGNHSDRFATCTINKDPTPVACTTDIPVEWTPARVAQLIDGASNLVNATATSYPIAPVGLDGGNVIAKLWWGR